MNSFSSESDRWDGEHYVNNSSLQYRWATAFIQKLQLQGHEKILDIGCGDGRISAMIAQSVSNGEVVGVDSSESMLQAARKLSTQIRLGNLGFLKRDAMQLGFDKEFDFIVSFSCFHWIPDQQVALEQIQKGLKPGGKVFLYFAPDHGRERVLDHAVRKVASTKKWASYFAGFSPAFSLLKPSKLADFAEKAHLLLKRMEIVDVHEVFPTKAAFAAWLSGWLPYLTCLPKESHQEFLSEIVEAYVKEKPLDKEGKLHFVDYSIEVELLKSGASSSAKH